MKCRFIKTMIMAVAATLLASANDAAALDLDISSFKATPRVRLVRDPEIRVSLAVVNKSGTVGGSAIATLQGVQNFKLLYEASIEVYDEPGHGHTSFDFPPIVAIQANDIVWTVEVHDDDPDVDQATDVTQVIWRVRQPGANKTVGDSGGSVSAGMDVTRAGFDPVAAGWTYVPAAALREESSMGRVKVQYSHR